jgi:hypothetical protein
LSVVQGIIVTRRVNERSGFIWSHVGSVTVDGTTDSVIVPSLARERQSAGTHRVEWNGRGDDGRDLLQRLDANVQDYRIRTTRSVFVSPPALSRAK